MLGCNRFYSPKQSQLSHTALHVLPYFVLTLGIVIFLTGIVFKTASFAKDFDHKPLKKLRLQLKWHHQFQFAGYYAAIEKGYFRNEGLEVELIEGKPGINPIVEILAGRADLAIDSPAVLIQRQQGKPIVAIAAIFQHSPTVIITRSDNHLTTPQSLKGKRIMLTPESDPESLAMLVGEGIQLQDLKILPHNWRVDDLIANRVDAQTAYLTNEPYFLKKAGMAITTIQPLNYGIDFYGDCIVATEHEVQSNFEQVESFVKAMQQGWLYAMEHHLELAELIRTKYSQEKSLEQLLFEAEAMSDLIQAKFVTIGHMNPARWKHIADTFVQLGMMKANYNLNGFLYEDFRRQIESEQYRKHIRSDNCPYYRWFDQLYCMAGNDCI